MVYPEAYHLTVATFLISSFLVESYDDMRTTAEKRTSAVDKKGGFVAQDVARRFSPPS